MLRLFSFFLLVISLSACSYVHPYRPTIQQGNIIKPEEVAQLKIGMTREQAVAIMDDPVLQNIFNDNQCAYIYTSKPNNGPLVYKRVILTFNNNRLVSIDKYL